MSQPQMAYTADGNRRLPLIRRLGEGGMGVVYEAIDRVSGDRVAAKLLRTCQPAEIVRHKRELPALRALHHEHLVRYRELVEDQGAWLLTMELIAGCDFLKWTGSGRALDETKLRAGLLQVERALGTLHASGRV